MRKDHVLDARPQAISCDEMKTLIDRYVDLELSNQMDVAVRAHLTVCEKCAMRWQIRLTLDDLPKIMEPRTDLEATGDDDEGGQPEADPEARDSDHNAGEQDAHQPVSGVTKLKNVVCGFFKT